MENKKRIIIIFVTAIIAAIAGAALSLVYTYNYFKNLPIPLENIIRTEKLIENSYVGKIDSEDAESSMINALVESLDDKYAVYYNEQNAKDTFELLEGDYVGIGIEVFANRAKDKIEVLSAYKGTPAYNAGIKSGDCIVSIDSKTYSADNLADAVLYMKGTKEKDPLSTEMEIVVERDGTPITFKIKRAKITLYKVDSEIIDGVCYIRYSGFTENSVKETKKIIDTLDSVVKGIVVDIRDNPGGDFDCAIEMCDIFLDDETIMYTEDKYGNKKIYRATDGKCDFPMAIIVNSQSASASEIFAGSLQANKRAVIVGEKTYGKGVTQTVRYINPRDKGAGAVKFTTLKNYTPDGKWINDAIVPDIEISAKINQDIRNDAAFLAAVNSIKKEYQK